MSTHSVRPRRPQGAQTVSWINAAVITFSPPAALLTCAFYIHENGFSWLDLTNFSLMYLFTGTAITAGYHRYYAHRAYECGKVLQFLMLCFGAAALQNSALNWVSDHRDHHRYTDRPEDPYNIKRGFFWAHMGWIYFKHSETREFLNVRDLQKSALVRWQDRYYVPIALIVGLGIPFVFGLLYARPWGGIIWGGLLRLVVVHHATFLINSAAHTFGKKTYSESTTARDSWWLPFFSFGEGYHNYHHTHPSDYRNGAAWYHWDTTKWFILALSVPGWTWGLRRSSIK